jgi:molecular chaperone GrpE
MKTSKTNTAPNTNPLVPKLQSEIALLKDRLTRSLADYVNLEKRIERDRQLLSALATTQIISQVVEVVDDLNLAYSHLQDSGLKMAIDKFANILKSYGLEVIDAQGKEFDPKTMECISAVEGKPDFVVSVERQGYLLNGTCLRPARVIVGKKLDIKS